MFLVYILILERNQSMRKDKIALKLSPLALLTLSACVIEPILSDLGSSAFSKQNGKVEDGPLHNAIAFLDYDGDGKLDDDEPSMRTAADGGYSLTPTQATYQIVAITDYQTIDQISGSVVSGVTLKAPAHSSMVTPTTTLMEDGGLTAEQVVQVLGLPTGMNPFTFSAHAAGVDPDMALAVELANQQILSVVNSFAATAEGSGVSEADAFSAALMSVAEVIKTEASKSTVVVLDLSNATALGAIETKLVQKVVDLAAAEVAAKALDTTVVLKISSDQFAKSMVNTVSGTAIVNTRIQSIEDVNLGSILTQKILSTSEGFANQAKFAAELTVTNNVGNTGDAITAEAIVFDIDDAMENIAPDGLDLDVKVISEAVGTPLKVGDVTTTDAANRGVASTIFKYSISKVKDTDHASFTIDQTTGALFLIEAADYEKQTSYTVVVTTTDASGKTYSKELTIAVEPANDAPTVANALVNQAFAEDVAISYQFDANVFADADIDDALAYTATLSDGSALPGWLDFEASTRTFSGTPANADVGVTTVKVTATDTASATVSDTFQITVTNTNGAASFAASSGKVEDGPLHNAIAFLDYDGDGELDDDEPWERTGLDGSYSLTPTQAVYSIVAITDETTVDLISGSVLSGVTLKAPSGSSMVTPTTTLMEDGNLTAEQVVDVLGLPAGMNPLTFSAHAAGVDPAKALAVEKPISKS